MKILKNFFISFIIPSLLLGDISKANITAENVHTPIPEWVQPCDFSLDPPPHPSHIDSQCLLRDIQYHVELQSEYWHYVDKILSKSGAEDLGLVITDFFPGYQQVFMHCIRVYRDGTWSDRLQKSNFKILQNSKNLSEYDEDALLVYFVEDLRVGDILEVSGSTVGVDPSFASHYSDRFFFQYESSIEKIHRRILAPSSHPFLIKSFNTSLKPSMRDLSPTLREWVWEDYSTSPVPEEIDQPSWFNPRARFEVSQYQNWHDLAKEAASLYSLEKKDEENLPSTMLDLVKIWEALTQDPTEKALLALRFVQDEIRYQAFPSGLGGFRPNNPGIIFERRFGDCKDKCFLLHILLKLMNISSVPIGIHTNSSPHFPEFLPSPFFFNHDVLKITIEKRDYYVDPTMSLQGGSLAETYFPDYRYGLLLGEQADLIALPSSEQKKPTEIYTTITLISPDQAEIKTQSIRYGSKADKMRRYVQNIGYKNLCDRSLKSVKHFYGQATVSSPLTFSDDRLANVFVINESYLVPTNDRLGKKTLKNYSYTIQDVLDPAPDLDRASPYSIGYPLWIKEQVSIRNPYTEWDPKSETLDLGHESIRYHSTYKIQGQNIDLDYELEYLKDHVPVESLKDYIQIIDKINESVIPSIEVTP